MHLRREGGGAKVDAYFDKRALRNNKLFHQLLHALIELAESGKEDRQILESLNNHVAARGEPHVDEQLEFRHMRCPWPSEERAMPTTAGRESSHVFVADYHMHVGYEMEMNRFDYVRGFLNTILSYIRQQGAVRITDSLHGRAWMLRDEQAFDDFVTDVNGAYRIRASIRFERRYGAIHCIRLDDEETLFKPLTEVIVDEAHPEAIILFGSRAGDVGRPGSDVDLLVVLPDEHEDRRRRRKLRGRIERRLAGTPVATDILVYTRSEVERWRNVPGHIIATSLEHGRPLYGQV